MIQMFPVLALALILAGSASAQFGQAPVSGPEAGFDPEPASEPRSAPASLPALPAAPIRHVFDPATARVVAAGADFDRVLDTTNHINVGSSTSPSGNCFGVNLTTVDWFKQVALPELRGGARAAANEPLTPRSRRLRAFSSTREGGREVARLALQFQDDQFAIRAAFSAREWGAYIERFPEDEREDIWRLYAQSVVDSPAAIKDRILRDLRDPARQLAMINIFGDPLDAAPPDPLVHPEDADTVKEIAELERRLAEARRGLEERRRARREEELRREQERLEEGGHGDLDGLLDLVMPRGTRPGDGPGGPDADAPPPPFGGRGFAPAPGGEAGHSLVVFKAEEGVARGPGGQEERVLRFRFLDPNAVETSANGGEGDRARYLLYFEASERFALAPEYLEEGLRGGINWHGRGATAGTFAPADCVTYSAVHERIYTVARRIQNGRQGDVREVVPPASLDFPRPAGPARDPRPGFQVPITDPGAPPEGTPADPAARPAIPRLPRPGTLPAPPELPG